MRRVVTAVLACIALAGCTQVTTDDAFQLAEFYITGPDQLDSGSNSLTVSNSGEFPHTLVVTASTGDVVAATFLVQPDETVEFSVDLAPDRYSFTCRIVSEDGEGNLIDHFEAGMAATVVVSD